MTGITTPKPPSGPPSLGLFLAACTCGWRDVYRTEREAKAAKERHAERVHLYDGTVPDA